MKLRKCSSKAGAVCSDCLKVAVAWHAYLPTPEEGVYLSPWGQGLCVCVWRARGCVQAATTTLPACTRVRTRHGTSACTAVTRTTAPTKSNSCPTCAPARHATPPCQAKRHRQEGHAGRRHAGRRHAGPFVLLATSSAAADRRIVSPAAKPWPVRLAGSLPRPLPAPKPAACGAACTTVQSGGSARWRCPAPPTSCCGWC